MSLVTIHSMIHVQLSKWLEILLQSMYQLFTAPTPLLDHCGIRKHVPKSKTIWVPGPSVPEVVTVLLYLWKYFIMLCRLHIQNSSGVLDFAFYGPSIFPHDRRGRRQLKKKNAEEGTREKRNDFGLIETITLHPSIRFPKLGFSKTFQEGICTFLLLTEVRTV